MSKNIICDHNEKGIEKQERPLCFQISSFTSSTNKKEDEKVRPS